MTLMLLHSLWLQSTTGTRTSAVLTAAKLNLVDQPLD
jgi:hypothetical protein